MTTGSGAGIVGDEYEMSMFSLLAELNDDGDGRLELIRDAAGEGVGNREP